jgi:Uri superfamily endonuclease
MDNPKYKDGKIYTIKNNQDSSLVYVGSTIHTLEHRLYRHKCDCSKDRCKNWLLYRTINNNWDDWTMSLHSNYPCNDRRELCRREGEVIREIGTLNCEIAGRTWREWYDDEKEVILKKKKIYYINNREMLKAKCKQNYINKKLNSANVSQIDTRCC